MSVSFKENNAARTAEGAVTLNAKKRRKKMNKSKKTEQSSDVLPDDGIRESLANQTDSNNVNTDFFVLF